MENNRKNILYIITKSNFGGAQRYVYDLATSLPKDKYNVVVAFGGSGVLKEKLDSQNIRTISLPSLIRNINPLKDIASFFKLISLIKKENPDIIHINSSKIGGLASFAGRIAGVKKIIFTCHGWPFNEERGFLSLKIIHFISWITVIFSHITITVSKRDEIYGKRMPFCNRKIRTIYNGIANIQFENRESAREKVVEIAKNTGTDIPKNGYIIGSIGELHNNKGYIYALQAMSDLKMSAEKNMPYLVIIGEGEERKNIEEFIKRNNLGNHVSLLGYINDGGKLLKAFDSFLLPSVKEGLPYVLIEAGLASLPVIATNVGGVGEIIEDMKTGILVQRKNPSEILKAIQYITEHQDKQKEFSQALFTKVTSVFSLDKMVEQTEKIYLF